MDTEKTTSVTVTGVIAVIVAAALAVSAAAPGRPDVMVDKTIGASIVTVTPDGTGPVGGLEWG